MKLELEPKCPLTLDGKDENHGVGRAAVGRSVSGVQGTHFEDQGIRSSLRTFWADRPHEGERPKPETQDKDGV